MRYIHSYMHAIPATYIAAAQNKFEIVIFPDHRFSRGMVTRLIYLNHSQEVYMVNDITLDLGHRNFAARYTPCLRLGVYLAVERATPFNQNPPPHRRYTDWDAAVSRGAE